MSEKENKTKEKERRARGRGKLVTISVPDSSGAESKPLLGFLVLWTN